MKVGPMKAFYALLVNTLIASVTNTFAWFAVTFWVYLETRSVIATSVMAGVFTVTVAVSGFLLGSLVDRYAKKRVMLGSSLMSLALYTLAFGIYVRTPAAVFKEPGSPVLWALVVLSLIHISEPTRPY